MISAIDGMPGVGKTALAVQAGHLVADRFPDRQLFVDLHGHTPGRQPSDPADVLAALLAADGVDPRYLPAGLDGRAAMWRDRIAGQRVLLILDNAASSAQVTPLLPGTAGCLVLVTSRRFLGDLPARGGAAAGCPAARRGQRRCSRTWHPGRRRAGPGSRDRRAVRSPAAGDLAARPAVHPAPVLGHGRPDRRDPGAAADRHRREPHGRGRVRGCPTRTWTPRRQRFFRILGLHPGADIDAYAAAALAGLPPGEAAAHLDALLRRPAAGGARPPPVPDARPDPPVRPEPGRRRDPAKPAMSASRPPDGCSTTTSTPPGPPTCSSPATPGQPPPCLSPRRPPRPACPAASRPRPGWPPSART